MKTFVLLLTVTVLAPRLLAAECAPAKTLRIVTQADGPEIAAGSFAALPKTVYRLGTKYARIEEEPDPANKIHGLVVSSAPDSWMVNLHDRTGRHIVDPDPNGDVVMPLFPPGSFGGLPPELSAIEMGCEAPFFDSHGSPTRVLKASGGDRIQQALGVGDWKLVLVRRAQDAPPEVLFVFKGDAIVYVLRYLSFEELAQPDMRLFSKPEGITFTEETPG